MAKFIPKKKTAKDYENSPAFWRAKAEYYRVQHKLIYSLADELADLVQLICIAEHAIWPIGQEIWFDEHEIRSAIDVLTRYREAIKEQSE